MSDDIQRPANRGELINLLRNLIKRSNTEGLSANDTLQRAQDLGLGIKRQEFLALRRDTLGPYRYQRQIQNLDDDRIIPASFHHVSDTIQMRTRFLYSFDVQVYDLEDETFETKHWTIGVNTQMDLETLKAQVTSQAESGRPGSQFQVIDIVATGAQAAQGVFGA